MDRWKPVREALRGAGIPVSAEVRRAGACLRPECVVCDGGEVRLTYTQTARGAGGTARCRIYLLCPLDRPDALHALEEKVEQALAPLVESRFLTLALPGSAAQTEDGISALSTYTEYISYYGRQNQRNGV